MTVSWATPIAFGLEPGRGRRGSSWDGSYGSIRHLFSCRVGPPSATIFAGSEYLALPMARGPVPLSDPQAMGTCSTLSPMDANISGLTPVTGPTASPMIPFASGTLASLSLAQKPQKQCWPIRVRSEVAPPSATPRWPLDEHSRQAACRCGHLRHVGRCERSGPAWDESAARLNCAATCTGSGGSRSGLGPGDPPAAD